MSSVFCQLCLLLLQFCFCQLYQLLLQFFCQLHQLWLQFFCQLYQLWLQLFFASYISYDFSFFVSYISYCFSFFLSVTPAMTSVVFVLSVTSVMTSVFFCQLHQRWLQFFCQLHLLLLQFCFSGYYDQLSYHWHVGMVIRNVYKKQGDGSTNGYITMPCRFSRPIIYLNFVIFFLVILDLHVFVFEYRLSRYQVAWKMLYFSLSLMNQPSFQFSCIFWEKSTFFKQKFLISICTIIVLLSMIQVRPISVIGRAPGGAASILGQGVISSWILISDSESGGHLSLTAD